jgi:hypothetical protein
MGYKVFHDPEGWFIAKQTSINPSYYDTYGEHHVSLQDLKKYVWSLKEKQDEHVDRMAEQRDYEHQME